MTIANGYTTLAIVRVQLGITTVAYTTEDAQIEQAVEAVSRMIDNYCGRRFYTTTEDETRYYTATTKCTVYTDDILSVTTLATDDYGARTYPTEWEATDYDLMPYNEGRYEWIELTPDGSYQFPRCNKGVKIIGKFGYNATAAIPDPIAEACILQTCRIVKRVTEAPFGVAGGGEMGSAIAIAKFDPDVEMLLNPYRRIL